MEFDYKALEGFINKKEIEKIFMKSLINNSQDLINILEAIRNNLGEIFDYLNITQTEAAKELHIARQTIINYIKKPATIPLEKLISILNIIKNKEEK